MEPAVLLPTFANFTYQPTATGLLVASYLPPILPAVDLEATMRARRRDEKVRGFVEATFAASPLGQIYQRIFGELPTVEVSEEEYETFVGIAKEDAAVGENFEIEMLPGRSVEEAEQHVREQRRRARGKPWHPPGREDRLRAAWGDRLTRDESELYERAEMIDDTIDEIAGLPETTEYDG